MLVVKFELSHGVDGVNREFLNRELLYLLCDNSTLPITFRLDLYLFCTVLLLNVLILHNII